MANIKFISINGTTYNVGYSSNDYTTAEKTKLAGIAEGAQVNVLEGVKVDGTDLTITGKKVNVDLATPIGAAKTAAINASKVTMTESAGTDSVLKVYTFTQNGAEIGKVNVPKDLVVSGGSIVEVEGVKYLRLTIANQTAPVDIAVTDLVDVYKGSTYITVGSDNAISVNFTALDAALKADTSKVGAAIKANATAAANAKSAADAAQATANANKTKLDGISEGANKTTYSYDDATGTLSITIA